MAWRWCLNVIYGNFQWNYPTRYDSVYQSNKPAKQQPRDLLAPVEGNLLLMIKNIPAISSMKSDGLHCIIFHLRKENNADEYDHVLMSKHFAATWDGRRTY